MILFNILKNNLILQFHLLGLQYFNPEEKVYDIMWIQWVLCPLILVLSVKLFARVRKYLQFLCILGTRAFN